MARAAATAVAEPVAFAPVDATAAVPAAQLAPEVLERADDPVRLARRIESVLRRRTARVVVVLERLCDGHNYSAVLRTAEALGIQHVYLINPPEEGVRYQSSASAARSRKQALLKRTTERDANRGAKDPAPTPGSRKDRRLKAAEGLWEADQALDANHASAARGASRFLSVREFKDADACLDALREEKRTVWATDLGQGASVLAPGAAWLTEEEGACAGRRTSEPPYFRVRE